MSARQPGLPWQDLASALVARYSGPRCDNQGPKRGQGHRRLSQDTVRALRAEYAASEKRVGLITTLARKYGMSAGYAGKLLEGGLRDDEREG